MGAAAAEPGALCASLEEAKAYLRIGTSEEDALLAGMLRSAGETCEAFTGRMLIERAVEEIVPARTAWTRLAAAPVRSIETVAALEPDGSAIALAPEDYAIDLDAAGEGWVRLTRSVGAKRIRVGYRAGLAADRNGVPEALRHGIVRLCAHLYTHRDREDGRAPPAAVTALWRPWRRLTLGAAAERWMA